MDAFCGAKTRRRRVSSVALDQILFCYWEPLTTTGISFRLEVEAGQGALQELEGAASAALGEKTSDTASEFATTCNLGSRLETMEALLGPVVVSTEL